MSDYSKRLENYEPVAARLQRFKKDHPDGRVIPTPLPCSENSASFMVQLFKNAEEQRAGLPLSQGHAKEFKGVNGVANKYSWSENCETSAIGRALANAGYAGDMSCSREEMAKVFEAEESDKMSQQDNSSVDDKKPMQGINTSWTESKYLEYIKTRYGVQSTKNLTEAQQNEMGKLIRTISFDEAMNELTSFDRG